MRLETLEEKIWWWRSDEIKKTFNFKRNECLAFNYELARRAKRSLHLKPFPELASLCRFAAPALDEMPPEQMPFRLYSALSGKSEGWARLLVEWNLKLCDSPLQDAFQSLVNLARDQENLPMPRRNAHRRNRPVSWVWLELMDLAYFECRILTDNEQSTERQARKKAKAKLVIFQKELQNYKKYLDYASSLNYDDDPAPIFGNPVLPRPPKTHFKLYKKVWPTDIRNI